jgi:hypothetical protein
MLDLSILLLIIMILEEKEIKAKKIKEEIP